jgi:hypothetical protein
MDLSLEKINQYKIYINEHINELKISDRKEILQMLIYDVDDKKIKEKGNGTQIKFDDINNNLLINVYNYLYNKIENSKDIF